MSEAELHLIRARLDGGLRNKAERGELALSLPVGLDRDEQGRVVLSADEQVRATIAHVFSLWERLGSARQVVAELIAAGERLPRRTVGERRVRRACSAAAAAAGGCRSPTRARAAARRAMPVSAGATCTAPSRPANRLAAAGSTTRSLPHSWRRSARLASPRRRARWRRSK